MTAGGPDGADGGEAMTRVSPILVPGGRLSGALADTWAGEALAEITHAPTGYVDLDMTPVLLAPGEAATVPGGRGPLLLAVLRGRICVSAPATPEETGRDTLVAAAGDAVAVPAGLTLRVDAPEGEPAEYLVYVLPAPGDGSPP
jgi:hypothetical protein